MPVFAMNRAARCLVLISSLFSGFTIGAGDVVTSSHDAAATLVSRIVLADNSTYLIGRDGRLFVMGEVTLWADKVKGAKGCPVLYSSCSDVPLLVDLPFGVDSLAAGDSMVHLVSRDGAVFVHGLNRSGRTGIESSSDAVGSDNKFDLRSLPYPEPIKRISASSDAAFAFGLSGVVYVTPFEDLSHEASGKKRPWSLESLAPIRSIKHANGLTFAMDADGSIWTIAARAGGPLHRSVFQRIVAAKALDFEVGGDFLYVLYRDGTGNNLACYRLDTERPALELKSPGRVRCPYGTDRMALPKSGNLRLSALGNRAVVVVDDMSRRTYLPALDGLRFWFPWLNDPKNDGVLPGALHSQRQRYALIGHQGIFLVGDGPFMENGSPDGKTSFQPSRLKDFSWSNE